MEEYGATLAQLLQAQLRPNYGERVLHIGSPGATQLAEQIAPRLATSELVVCVYTFDELEETRAALAGMGNVHVINDLDDLDEDEPPFDIVSCVAPFQLGRDIVTSLIEQGVARMASDGAFFLAGDKQREFDRYIEALSALARDVKEVAVKGQYRVVTVQGRNVRKSGRLGVRQI